MHTAVSSVTSTATIPASPNRARLRSSRPPRYGGCPDAAAGAQHGFGVFLSSVKFGSPAAQIATNFVGWRVVAVNGFRLPAAAITSMLGTALRRAVADKRLVLVVSSDPAPARAFPVQ